jgi:hypothetical protein
MGLLELLRRHCVLEKSGITHLTTHPHLQEELNIMFVVLCFVFVQSDLSSYFSFRYKSSYSYEFYLCNGKRDATVCRFSHEGAHSQQKTSGCSYFWHRFKSAGTFY